MNFFTLFAIYRCLSIYTEWRRNKWHKRRENDFSRGNKSENRSPPIFRLIKRKMYFYLNETCNTVPFGFPFDAQAPWKRRVSNFFNSIIIKK